MPEGKGPTSDCEQEEGVDGTNRIDWPESGGRVLYIHNSTKVGREFRGENEVTCMEAGYQHLSPSLLIVSFCPLFGAFFLFGFSYYSIIL